MKRGHRWASQIFFCNLGTKIPPPLQTSPEKWWEVRVTWLKLRPVKSGHLQYIPTLALPWKLASSPDCTQILKLPIWVSSWASRSELTLLSHMGLDDMKLALVPADLDGWSVLTFSHSITHSDWYRCLAVLFLRRAKTNGWHRFVGPMAVDMNGGVQNYPKAENHRRHNYHYLSFADLPTALPAAKTMQLKLTLYTKISWFKTWTCNCFHR